MRRARSQNAAPFREIEFTQPHRFLRTYADYLGLDAQRLVDEYNTRFAGEEEQHSRAVDALWRNRDRVRPVPTTSSRARHAAISQRYEKVVVEVSCELGLATPAADPNCAHIFVALTRLRL